MEKKRNKTSRATRASQISMEWDREHELIPIQVKTTESKAEEFLKICSKYHISRRMVFDELVDEFNAGEIPVDKKTSIPMKINHPSYLAMSVKSKKYGYSKSQILSVLLDHFLDGENTEAIVKKMGVDIKNRPAELLAHLREIYDKVQRPIKTSDLTDSNIYVECFGTWVTAIYLAGSIDYNDFTIRRQKNKKPFDENELEYILAARVLELKDEDSVLDEENFPYPGEAIYKEVTGKTPLELLAQMEEKGYNTL